MQANLTVRRYDPDASPPRNWDQDYSLEVLDSFTVLDALIQIREEVDGTLTLRAAPAAPRYAGSCGMRVNGRARLACKTRIAELAPNGERLLIEPMGNQPVIKDLVVDLDTFFEQIRRVDPYLQPDSIPEEGEFIASGDSMTNLLGVMNCIMCGACVSDCTVLEVDDRFIGPAALAKAYRFAGDPRDDQTGERLTKLNDEHGGIWDCTRCFQCVEVCPKDVAPMDRIMELRDMAIEAGNRNTSGYRHTESFVNSVRRHGRVDETRLAAWTASAGLTCPGSSKEAPVAINALLKGKLPSPHSAQSRRPQGDQQDRREGRRKVPVKYAFYPGCVARGGAPELYESAMAVLDRLSIETVELTRASCTGAGVLQEKNRKLGDILNVRTLAMAEQLGLPIMTICSTCQGVISQANHAVQTRPEYLAEINAELAG